MIFGSGKILWCFSGDVQNQRPPVWVAILNFDDRTGAPLAVVYNGLVTYWKMVAITTNADFVRTATTEPPKTPQIKAHLAKLLRLPKSPAKASFS